MQGPSWRQKIYLFLELEIVNIRRAQILKCQSNIESSRRFDLPSKFLAFCIFQLFSKKNVEIRLLIWDLIFINLKSKMLKIICWFLRLESDMQQDARSTNLGAAINGWKAKDNLLFFSKKIFHRSRELKFLFGLLPFPVMNLQQIYIID